MLYCDYCPLNWHIDCLDPPPANPPPPSRKWQCPAHLDRHFVMRRPRNAKVQDTNLRRGHKNNGIIEIINEEDEEDAGFRDESRGGVIYRLPERGIKLDFLEHVHRKNAEERHRREQSILQSTYNNSRASSVPVAGPGALWSQDDIAAIEVLTSMGFKGQPEQPAEAKVPAFFARIVVSNAKVYSLGESLLTCYRKMRIQTCKGAFRRILLWMALTRLNNFAN